MLANRWLSGTTLTALGLLVGVPLCFVALQAVFPTLAQGSLADPFGAVVPTLADPVLVELTVNTLRLGATVVLLAALIGIPLGMLRGLYRLPGAPVWDLLMNVPYMNTPYIAAKG